jgi:hypothetical protein
MTADAEARVEHLRGVAQRAAEELPAFVEEVILTGSVSRGVADELSDVEMLLVSEVPLDLAECFDLARRMGLTDLESWGVQGTEVSRVFGYFEQVPVETIWWSRTYGERSVAASLAGERSAAAEALVNGVALRSTGLLDEWQARLLAYPEALAVANIEDSAMAWGGFHPTGFLTLARPHERLALVEYLYGDAMRVLSIVYALNRVWQPTSKRLAARVETLPLKPERLAERIEEALTEPDAVRAMLVMCQLQIDTIDLAPPGPNVARARRWLREVREVIRNAAQTPRGRTERPEAAGSRHRPR